MIPTIKMETVMNTSQINKPLIIAAILAFLMLLTRGSHVMTHVSLPDASFQAFCLTDGYWGMLPTYAVMWLAGVWLGKQAEPNNVFRYVTAGVLATFFAFVISTQTYYLFSGRFPAEGVIEALKHGWEYLPSYMGYTLMYLAAFWVLAQALPKLNLRAPVTTS
jgi:hypothetical protein